MDDLAEGAILFHFEKKLRTIRAEKPRLYEKLCFLSGALLKHCSAAILAGKVLPVGGQVREKRGEWTIRQCMKKDPWAQCMKALTDNETLGIGKREDESKAVVLDVPLEQFTDIVPPRYNPCCELCCPPIEETESESRVAALAAAELAEEKANLEKRKRSLDRKEVRLARRQKLVEKAEQVTQYESALKSVNERLDRIDDTIRMRVQLRTRIAEVPIPPPRKSDADEFFDMLCSENLWDDDEVIVVTPF